MDGDVVPLLHQGGQPAELPNDSTIGDQWAMGQHPLDTAVPVPMRTKLEILMEGLLIVPNLALLVYKLLRDDRVPRKRRLVLYIAGLYIASPIDLIPEAVPVLGAIDDLLVLAFAIDYLMRVSPPEVVDEHWDGSEDALEFVRGIAAWGVELIPGRLRRVLFVH